MTGNAAGSDKDNAAGFTLSQAANSGQRSQEQNDAASSQTSSGAKLDEEIVVTAQKRAERLQDVPVPVTALNTDALFDTNQVRLQDYYTRIPGLSVTPQGVRGAPMLAIRGITSGDFANPTVGITVDDVPYGSSTFIGGGYMAPEIDPSDLARIEVLRGPQGALYGVSSLGGLLKYETVDPSTDRITGRVQAGTSSVRNGDGLGYNARGSINLPFGDTFAVRASAFTRREAGYIDNVQSGQQGVNQEDADGGRVAALWRPSDTFSVKLSALLQDVKTHGSALAEVQPGLGDLEQIALPGIGGFHRKNQAYSANITAKLGRMDLAAVSGYSHNTVDFRIDYTPGLLTPAEFENPLETTKFTQEVRLSAPIGERLEWLLGGFYTDEDSTWISNLYLSDAATGERLSTFLHYRNPTTFKEYALFGNLTIRFTERFDLQLGGRESRSDQTSSAVTVFGGTSTVTQETDSRHDAFTYLVTPRLKVSPTVMVYARLASGYRAGGPNANFVFLGVPSSYKPDKTQNYDLGVKASFFDQALSIDASAYYIDWKDVQISVNAPNSPGSVYTANGARSKSQGLELVVTSRPVAGLTIAANGTLYDAKLAEDFPITSSSPGKAGDRLPYISRFTGSLSVNEEFAIAGEIAGFVGGRVSYVGKREGNFSSSALRQQYPSYTTLDLNVGANFNSWTANIYANNITDKRGILSGGLDSLPINSFTYIRPRIIGLSLSRVF